MKVFLVTLLLTQVGVIKHEKIFIGELDGRYIVHSKNYKICEQFKRQREFTYHIPNYALGAAHICEVE